MNEDPLSWYMIESGWAVYDNDGDEAGRVEEVLGDTERDIFDGITIATGVFSVPRYLPSEHVTGIVDGGVKVELSTPEIDKLDAYDP